MYVHMFPLSLRVSASVQYPLWPFRVCTILIGILICLFEVWLIVYTANLCILFHVLFAIIYPITHLKPNIAPEKCLKHDGWNTYFPFEMVAFQGTYLFSSCHLWNIQEKLECFRGSSWPLGNAFAMLPLPIKMVLCVLALQCLQFFSRSSEHGI